MADGLYVSTRVLETCKEKGWDYIIRYKESSAPSIAKEYERIPEKNRVGKAEYVNGVVFNDFDVNVLKYTEKPLFNGTDIRLYKATV